MNIEQIKRALFHLSRQTGFSLDDSDRLHELALEIKLNLK